MDGKECWRRLGLAENLFYVGFVGSFAPWQGLALLVEAAKDIKLYEYLACGKPVIAADIEGVREIIEENECGFIFKAGEKSQLVSKVLHWCKAVVTA